MTTELQDKLDVKEEKIEGVFIEDVFKVKTLRIPNYQRPYRWGKVNVDRLLEDIAFANRKPRPNYRIGTLIRHNNKEEKKMDIVDGQQRLVTLSLILSYLGNYDSALLDGEFKHYDSRKNIFDNYAYIKKWFERYDNEEKSAFKGFILKGCKMVCITLQDVSEAFQLFDSQNARGKPLEPYDLLKAYHLREMDKEDTDKEKLQCVMDWEKAWDNGLLGNLGKYLFRIRKWMQNDPARSFTKDEIGEFKGMNLSRYQDFPYLRANVLNKTMVEQVNKNPLNQIGGLKMDFPFQIQQLIINGKLFFEYTAHYSSLYKKLFEDKGTDFYGFYEKYCLYDKSYRVGDTYVRELFQAAIMAYYDRFGDVGFEENYIGIYKWAYLLRLSKGAVRYLSIDKYVNEDNLFSTLRKSYLPEQVAAKLSGIHLPHENKIEMKIEDVMNAFKITRNGR